MWGMRAMKLISHHILIWVLDMDRAIEFYTKTLELPVKFTSGTFSVVGGDKFWISLHLGTQNRDERRSQNKETSIINFKPSDVDEAHKVLVQKGVEFYAEPYWAAPNVRVAEFFDTEGNRLALSSAD